MLAKWVCSYFTPWYVHGNWGFRLDRGRVELGCSPVAWNMYPNGGGIEGFDGFGTDWRFEGDWLPALKVAIVPLWMPMAASVALAVGITLVSAHQNHS